MKTLIYNSTFSNAIGTLKIAKNQIINLANITIDPIPWINNTLNSTITLLNALGHMASTQGIKEVGNCTRNTPQFVANFGIGLAENMSACSINTVNNGLAMVNADIAYVNYLTNLTTAIPIAMNDCMLAPNPNFCRANYLTKVGFQVANAPVQVGKMVLQVKIFVESSPLDIEICMSNATFNAVVYIGEFGSNVTTCIKNLVKKNK